MADITPSPHAGPNAAGNSVGNSVGKPIGAQLIIPIAAIAFTIYYFWTIADAPWTAQVSAFFVGCILLLLCIVFLIRQAFAVRRGRATLGLGDFVTRADVTSGRAAIFALALLYVFVIPWSGFSITTFVFLFLSIAILNRGRRLRRAGLVSFLMVMAGYLLFVVAFNVRIPHGPFEILMQKVF